MVTSRPQTSQEWWGQGTVGPASPVKFVSLWEASRMCGSRSSVPVSAWRIIMDPGHPPEPWP